MPTRLRLLAMDLDGTLIVGRHEVSPATRQALGRAHRAGMHLAIATGRRYGSARRVAEALGLPVPVLCLSGTLLKSVSEDTLLTELLDAEQLAAIAGVFGALGLSVVGYRDAHAAGGAEAIFDRSAPWNAVVSRYFERSRGRVEQSPSFADEPRADVLLASTFGDHDALLCAEARLHEQYPGALTTQVMPTPGLPGSYMEVVRDGVSKWSGLLHLAEQLGIAAEEICAVGDELNDLAMIEGAGLGVAMGNAAAEVQAAADWVCGRHDEDGLVGVVERILGE